ncbi:MAG TPA: hypothetical protein VI504_05245, partial [Candidatus Eisenbacteria bacterium]
RAAPPPDAAATARAGETPSEPPASSPRLRFYLDCDEQVCDFAFLKQEIPWVDWVRDRRDADVYVLVTTRETGGGGTEGVFYVARPHGGGPAADTLRVFVRAEASDDEGRRQLLRALQALLARDLAARPEGERLDISLRPAGAGAPPADGAPGLDRWNHWVVRLAGDGFWNGQRTFRTVNVVSNAGASRVVESSKLSLSEFYNYSEQRFESPHFLGVQRGWGTNARAVWSLGSRWSLGGRGLASSSKFANQHLAVGAGPALEYDVYPYAESSRHLLTLAGELVGRHVRYDAVTVYGKRAEILWTLGVSGRLALTEPWGTLGLGPDLSQYLHDASKYRLSLAAEAQLKLVRGLSLDLSSFAARIHDQVSLPRGGAADADVLLQQLELATSYQYVASVGLAYTFGSRTNNVVNPRLKDVYGSF